MYSYRVQPRQYRKRRSHTATNPRRTCQLAACGVVPVQGAHMRWHHVGVYVCLPARSTAHAEKAPIQTRVIPACQIRLAQASLNHALGSCPVLSDGVHSNRVRNLGPSSKASMRVTNVDTFCIISLIPVGDLPYKRVHPAKPLRTALQTKRNQKENIGLGRTNNRSIMRRCQPCSSKGSNTCCSNSS